MRKRTIRLYLLLLSLGLFALAGLPGAWAQEDSRLEVTSIDTTNFPDVTLHVIATDGESRRLPDLGGLGLTEAGEQIVDLAVSEAEVGTELIFVIDANATINDRDEAGGLTRYEKVRDSIISYANEYMDDSQLDRVSIIVPSENGPVLLLDRAIFPNAVINEINFYESVSVDPTPLDEMLNMALDHAADDLESARFQSILLFTDGAELSEQLNYDVLLGKAQAVNIPIFSAILGARADDDEIANVSRLSQPTRGSYLHMPQPADSAPIYGLVQSNQPQFQVTYRSKLASSGNHPLTLELAGARDETELTIEVEPAAVEIVVDNSRPIRRVVSSPDDPLTAAEPVNQPLVAHITWPDGHPRSLVDATLIVDGNPQPPISTPALSADGLITLDWDISNIDEGTYELFVKTTDELGLQGQSSVFPMAIVVEGRADPGQAGSVAEPTTEAAVAEPEDSRAFMQNLGIAGIVLGLLALFGAILILIVAVVMLRRRKPGEAAAVPAPDQALEHDATQVIMPAFAAQASSKAYFEPLENAPDYRGQIEITNSDFTIGRDPKMAQLVFADKSVSRLHARIMEQDGVYQLYDEGSASGTYINFNQITLKPQTLNDNDDIHFGRVHLRFHVVPVTIDADSTQVMPSPLRPGERAPAAAVEEDLSTQPYMPGLPKAGGQPQSPPPQGAPPTPAADDDEDDISTRPYMPHAPRR